MPRSGSCATGYSHTEATAADAKRAGRAAEALVETTRRVNAG